MKKTLFLLVSLLLLLSAAPISADNTRTSGLYTYEVKGNGTITITDFNWENNEADVFIPNMIDGYSVTGIGDGAFAYGDIGDRYLERRTHYVVTLQDGITTIGDKAFWNADIAEINIPSSVQRIGAGAFYGCPYCQFKIAPNHSYFAVIDEGLYDKRKKELLALSWRNVPLVNHEKRVTIPEGIQSIGAYSLADALVDVVSPSTLTAIGDYAFWRSSGSLSGDLSYLTTIGVGAFMESFVIDDDLTLPSVETIGEMAFQDALISANLDFTGAPIKQLKAKTFYNAHHLHSERYAIISTDSSLEQIGDDVFNGIHEVVPTFEIAKCSDIGRGNPGIGAAMQRESDFSPLLTTIPAGLNPQVTSLPPTVTAIESGAFTEAVSDFHLSASLKDIAVDAFPRGSTFIVDAGSYAELWCSENGFGYSIEGQNNLDWLNN